MQRNEERSCTSQHMWQDEAFSTPSFKAAPSSFVVRRSNRTTLSDSSPLPEAFDSVVDEDAWMKMNKGFVADLDSLHITPAVKVRSLSSDGVSPVSLFFKLTQAFLF